MQVTDATYVALATSCPSLEEAKLCVAATDTSLRALRGCKHLTRLNLRKCEGVSVGAVLAFLAGCCSQAPLLTLLLPCTPVFRDLPASLLLAGLSEVACRLVVVEQEGKRLRLELGPKVLGA